MKESRRNHSSLNIRTPTPLTNVGNIPAPTDEILNKYSVRIIPYRKYDKWYLFDMNMDKIISEAYDSADFIDFRLTSSKSIIVRKNGLSAIFGNEYDIITRNWYSVVEPLRSDSNILIACKDGQFGLISNSDDTLVPFEYDLIKDKLHCRYLSQYGLLCVRKNGYYGLIRLKDYRQVLRLEYDDITDFCNKEDGDFLKIEKGGEVGVFSMTTNSILLLGEFEDVSKCNNGICSVKKNGKWLLYNYEDNSFVNDVPYDLTSPFINGFAVCKKDGNTFLVYENGKEEIIQLKKSNEDASVDFQRFDDVLIGAEKKSSQGENSIADFSGETYVFHVFRGSEQLSKITHKTRSMWCTAKLNEAGVVEILTAGEYLAYSTVKYYSIHGEEVDGNSIQHLNSEDKENRSASSSNSDQSSSWRIDKHNLFYNEELVFEYPDGELVSDLSLDFPKIAAIVGFDPEIGIKIKSIGYVDQKGKMYWEGMSSGDSFDKK